MAFGRRVAATGSRRPSSDIEQPAESADGRQAAIDAQRPVGSRNPPERTNGAAGARLSSGQPGAARAGNLGHEQGAETAAQLGGRLQAILGASEAIAAKEAAAAQQKQADDEANLSVHTETRPLTGFGNPPAYLGTDPSALHAHLSQETSPQQAQPAEGGEMGSAAGHWQAPYNHLAYADEPAHITPSASPSAYAVPVPAAHPGNSSPSLMHNSLHSDQSRAHSSAKSAAVRASAVDAVLQQQYDNLLVDLAAQQQQAQLPEMRHSRLWTQQQQQEQDIVSEQPSAPAFLAPVSTSNKSVQAMRSDAHTSPATFNHASVAEVDSMPAESSDASVVLPDDPFQQQLPQHLLDQPKLLQPDAQMPQPDIPLPFISPENSTQRETAPLSVTSMPSDQGWIQTNSQLAAQATPRAEDSLLLTPPLVSQQASSVSVFGQPAMQASAANGQTITQFPNAVPQLSNETSSNHNLSADGSSKAVLDSQAEQQDSLSKDSAKQETRESILRASLAEWLADAVASRLWSAVKKAQPDVAHSVEALQDEAFAGVPGTLQAF